MQTPNYLEKPPNWTADERPALPGSPASIAHARPIAILYFIIGMFVTIAGGMGNGFTTANLPYIQGEYGLTTTQAAWFPAAYVIGSMSSSILAYKARQQQGIRWFTEVSLFAFLVVTGLHLLTHSYELALLVRGLSGFAGGTLSTLGLFYIMQGVKKQYKLHSLYFAMAAGQLGVPLAWVISPYLLSADNWGRLYSFEFGLTLCCFAMVMMLKLPRGVRIQVFNQGDIVAFVLLTAGFGALAGVLVQGPIVWWQNDPMLAYWLIFGFGALMLAFFIEHHRRLPLVDTRWLTTIGLLRFLMASILLRFLMAEQSWATVNFLRNMGMGSDQFVGLYAIIVAGTFVGGMVSAMTFSPKTVFIQLLSAGALIAIASYVDANLTSDVRPQNFYLSQFLIGCAGGMFIGPMLLVGFVKAMLKSPNHIAMLIILFTASQNFGGLLGSSFYSTYQQQQFQVHRQAILNDMPSNDPQSTLRLAQYQASYRPTLTDSNLTSQQATTTLNQVINREATVLAFSDVIRFNFYLALAGIIWGFAQMIIVKRYLKKNPLPIGQK
ncbi:MFS transporter [uncultured Moraxella sp.]|uniref:MFS transporter n=1 Tax=uncultured Moraxella sp. TaxID=263769 RepID=UPI0025FBE7EA|nr:MFS transporter [uncultured Moraxella sp.]